MTNRWLFIFSGLCVIAGVSYAQTAATNDFPSAEWDSAKVILMHTPGEELFDGVIHPSAGLFEHYFDVEQAAMEHKGYIQQLEKQGIKVITIKDILLQMPLDSLRALANDALVYDAQGLAIKDTVEYAESYRLATLQSMTRADLIRILLLQPTVHLSSVDNNTGVEASYEHQPLMNLYFTRDQSISTPRGHIIGRMNSLQRARETSILRACYAALGEPAILEIKGEGRLEGGDYIPAQTVSFIGCGMRTNMQAIEQMMQADAFGHDTVIVVKDHRLWQMQMHLDTHFNIIDKDLCTMVQSRYSAKKGSPNFVTVDIYVRPVGTKKYKLWKKDLGFVELMLQRGYTIIPIEEVDEMHYANNFLTIGPRHIMAVGGQSVALQKEFQQHGVKVEWIPLESLIDGYGAAHCMTQVLRRTR